MTQARSVKKTSRNQYTLEFSQQALAHRRYQSRPGTRPARLSTLRLAQ
ncbi:hypothetical protein [Gibbsiella quercinecans]